MATTEDYKASNGPALCLQQTTRRFPGKVLTTLGENFASYSCVISSFCSAKAQMIGVFGCQCYVSGNIR